MAVFQQQQCFQVLNKVYSLTFKEKNIFVRMENMQAWGLVVTDDKQ